LGQFKLANSNEWKRILTGSAGTMTVESRETIREMTAKDIMTMSSSLRGFHSVVPFSGTGSCFWVELFKETVLGDSSDGIADGGGLPMGSFRFGVHGVR
jgi:hypothetical protein